MNEGARKLKALGITQALVAQSVGTDQGTVCRWETGDRKPSAKLRAKLEDIYKIAWRAWDESVEAEPASTGTDGGQ